MRKIYSLALALLVSMASFAQITSVKQGDKVYEVVGTEVKNLYEPAAVAYSGGTASFASQLQVMIDSLHVDATTDNFVQVDAEGNAFAFNANDGWHSADGMINGYTWGSAEKLVCIKPWSSEGTINGSVSYIGCIDETWTAGETHTFHCALLNDTQAYVLEFVVNFFEGNAISYNDASYEIVKDTTLEIKELAGVAYSGSTANFQGELAALLQAVGLEAASAETFVQVDATNKGFYYNTNDGWHAADGMIEGKTWGSESGLVCVKPWNGDAIDGTISYIGCIDDSWKTGSSHTFRCAVINDGKAAVLNIVINFISATVADPVLEISKLNVVKEYDFPVELYAGKSYEGRDFKQALEGVYEALGTTADDFDIASSKLIFAESVATLPDSTVIGDEKFPFFELSGQLVVPSEAAGDGWCGRYINTISTASNPDGEEIVVAMAPMPWASSAGLNTIMVNKLALKDGVISFNGGQYPGTYKLGDKESMKLYVVNGEKAAVVNLQISINEVPGVELGEKVGESSVDITADIDNSYVTKPFTVDLETVAAALGCTSDDIQDIYSWASEGTLSNDHTEGSGGFFFNEEGYITAWGSTAAFFVAISNLQNGEFSIGQMANHYTGITEDVTNSAQIVFAYGDKYYVVTVNYTVKAPGETPSLFTLKGTEYINKQIIPNSVGYNGAEKTEIDVEYIASLIGTTEFSLYTNKYNSDEAKLEWANNYTCTPAPGFWFGSETYENEEHQVVVDNAGWGGNCSFGITYASGVITWWEIPDARQVGDAYTAELFLVNDETGDYVKYILNVSYVDEVVPEAENVGTETINITVTGDALAFFENKISIDMSKCYEALGLDAETVADATLLAYKSITTTSEVSFEDMLPFATNGMMTSDAAADYVCGIYASDGISIEVDPCDLDFSKGSGNKASVRFALELDGKRYTFIVNFLAAEFTPIEKLLAAATVNIFSKVTGEAAYVKEAQNVSVGNVVEAMESTNAVTQFKIEEVKVTVDGAEKTAYQFRALTPAGADYGLWGCNPTYLNAQTNPTGVSFVLGKDQDQVNGSAWELIHNEADDTWAIKNIATGAYFAGTNTSEEAVYWTIGTITEEIQTAISSITAPAKANGKFIKNGQIVILRNGVMYNVAGAIVK